MTDRLGQQFGNYRLVSLLGQGGYAEVYLGQHVRLDLQAAIKVLHTHLTESEAEHFQQEAQTIARLAHPSIIRVFDFDVQDGTPFLVMDYAPNGSLRQRYARGSLMPLPLIVSYVKQVSAALQYAHDKKFIHRDVKPENMLIGQHQEVLLSDFGIATIAHSTSSLNVGAEGASGTLAYMAPEQIEGHPRAASDQYALGVVIYEWLCGERPFEGSASEVMAQHLSVPPPSLRERVPTIPVEIEQVVLKALSKDPKARFASVADFATSVELASRHLLSSTAQHADEQPAIGLVEAKGYDTVLVEPGQSKLQTALTPSADFPAAVLESTLYPNTSTPDGHDTPPSETPQQGSLLTPTAAVVSPPLEPTMPVKREARRISRTMAGFLIGLAVLVVVGGILGSVSLLAHLGMISAHSNNTTISPVRGGTWIDDFYYDIPKLIPPATYPWEAMAEQALYLPLFYGDAQGVIHPGAATEIPTVQNGGVNADATTWTFHLRPHLMWSDGQPYDARDVDFTWNLWNNPKFNGGSTLGMMSSADVSADHLSITIHLKQPYASFLALWVDGASAPLPAHHFSSMAPEAILKSPDNLNPRVVSGPFMMSESVPGDHYTLVRNPRYYRASEGLPYLDKVIIHIAPTTETVLKDLQTGSIDSYDSLDSLDVSDVPAFQHFNHYTLIGARTSSYFMGLFFNFHNIVLATHREVRAAIAMAINHQDLIATVLHGFGEQLCTDHGSAYHPGYDPNADCPPFDPSAANKLLDDNGWAKGPDGVRTKGKQRLEFELSTNDNQPVRRDTEVIVQRNLSVIGIKLDIQNYGPATFFGSFLPGGNASPSTGAISGRYDIAVAANGPGHYDPDDSSLASCDQFPSAANNFTGSNTSFYCNHALDALYKQEQTTVDAGLRQQIFSQIHQVYLTDFPFIALYFPLDVAIVRKGAHNYLPSPFAGETVNIWEWWCDHGKC